MNERALRRFLLCAASAAAAALLLYAALRYALLWLLPFLTAFAAAAAIEPAVRFLHARLRLRRSFSALVLTLFLVFVLGGLLSLFGAALAGEAAALLERAPALLDALPAALDALLARVERYSAACPAWLRERIEASLARTLADAETLLGDLAGRLVRRLGMAATAVPGVVLAVATTVLAIYFTSASLPELKGFVSAHLSPAARRRLLDLRGGLAASARRWLRAELTLGAVTFSLLLAGLLLLREPYALLLALLITLVDALPVFGTGTVLLPWAAAALLLQNTPKAMALAALYLVTLVAHNVLEPRLLGAQAGLPPIASLLAMYLGYCACGVAGMVLFPFLLLLAAQLYRMKMA